MPRASSAPAVFASDPIGDPSSATSPVAAPLTGSTPALVEADPSLA